MIWKFKVMFGDGHEQEFSQEAPTMIEGVNILIGKDSLDQRSPEVVDAALAHDGVLCVMYEETESDSTEHPLYRDAVSLAKSIIDHADAPVKLPVVLSACSFAWDIVIKNTYEIPDGFETVRDMFFAIVVATVTEAGKLSLESTRKGKRES